jgi:hypothetical protein
MTAHDDLRRRRVEPGRLGTARSVQILPLAEGRVASRVAQVVPVKQRSFGTLPRRHRPRDERHPPTATTEIEMTTRPPRSPRADRHLSGTASINFIASWRGGMENARICCSQIGDRPAG